MKSIRDRSTFIFRVGSGPSVNGEMNNETDRSFGSIRFADSVITHHNKEAAGIQNMC